MRAVRDGGWRARTGPCGRLLPCLALAHLIAASPPPPAYVAYVDTDVTPCLAPCERVGACGYNDSTPVCDPAVLAAACDALIGCTAFNSNGWLKGCAAASCGAAFEPSSGTTTWVKDGGDAPAAPVAPVEDAWYSDAQPAEDAALSASLPALLAVGDGAWAMLRASDGTTTVNVSVGARAFGFTLAAASADAGGPFAVLERSFAQWGATVFVRPPCAAGGATSGAAAAGAAGVAASAGASGAAAPGAAAAAGAAGGAPPCGEFARLRRSVGRVAGLSLPDYSRLPRDQGSYYVHVAGDADDYLGTRILADSGGEPGWRSAAAYLTPQREYASIGAIAHRVKFSVAPDGRVKRADGPTYTPGLARNDTGPGRLVFDPAAFVEAWPLTNWSVLRSGLVGGYLRVVATAGYDAASARGFEQLAFAPSSSPVPCVLVRVRSTRGVDGAGADVGSPFQYLNASQRGGSVARIDGPAFYGALLAESATWAAALAGAARVALPGAEGARQVDAAWGGLVAALSLYVGLQPNYGDGGAYWAPNTSLSSALLPVAAGLLDWGLGAWACARVGYYLDTFVRADGSLPECDPCEAGGFGDALADYGETQDLVVRVAQWALAYDGAAGAAWVAAHVGQLAALSRFALALRVNATARGARAGVTRGMVWGSPEHDTCHEPDFYYHNNAWLLRGMRQTARFLAASGGAALAPLAAQLASEAAAYSADLDASLLLAAGPEWVPPIAALGTTPFGTMTESSLASYSNFRYYAELLSADVIPLAHATTLQRFRESRGGTVAGNTHFEAHLDNMPAAGYAWASLWHGRLDRFWLLAYSHMANYASRGTLLASEQLPYLADSLGAARDYLWSYLEGGIDECVPSLMLPTLATRWALLLEHWDVPDTLWVARGAPRRWYDGEAFSLLNAPTRFGALSFVVAPRAPAHSLGGADAPPEEGAPYEQRMSVAFAPPPQPPPRGGGAPPLVLVLRMRAAAAPWALVSCALAGPPSVTIESIDAGEETVTVRVADASLATSFAVTATFNVTAAARR